MLVFLVLIFKRVKIWGGCFLEYSSIIKLKESMYFWKSHIGYRGSANSLKYLQTFLCKGIIFRRKLITLVRFSKEFVALSKTYLKIYIRR